MSVRELLATHTSRELAEWVAYDRVYGFGDHKLYDVLAALHEQVQLTNHILGQAHFADEDNENPIPFPTPLPRGGEREPVEDDDEE
jgi:hypothetical protein